MGITLPVKEGNKYWKLAITHLCTSSHSITSGYGTSAIILFLIDNSVASESRLGNTGKQSPDVIPVIEPLYSSFPLTLICFSWDNFAPDFYYLKSVSAALVTLHKLSTILVPRSTAWPAESPELSLIDMPLKLAPFELREESSTIFWALVVLTL